jgi:hypothetical protein
MRVSAMGKATCMMVLAVLVLSAGRVSALDPEDVSTWFATGPVCYQLSAFPNERYKLDLKTHGLLSEALDTQRFGYPMQIVFSVVGKHVGTCGEDTVRPVVGTLISTVRIEIPQVSTIPIRLPLEVQLGLESFNTTGVPNDCRDVEISCKAENMPEFPPSVWTCFGQNKFNLEFAFALTRVDELKDPRCSLLQHSAPDQAILGGSATGLMK